MNKKLQVFVSSTYTDLIEERQAAVEAILDAGHIPAGMELFKAGNESQLETINRWIDESDVYMLILGGRYGSIETNTGKSYTQLEYEYAMSKNIPIFTVVLSESFLTKKISELGLSNVLEQNDVEKYKVFKSLVMSKIVRIIDDCKDIKITIYSTLNDFVNKYNLVGWIRNKKSKQNNTNIDEYYFKKIVDLFKNKKYDYVHSSELEEITYTINALDVFINNFILFCFGIPIHYINEDNMNQLFFKICLYFENFGLLDIDTENLKMIKSSQLGKSFYVYLKSLDMVSI